MQPPLISVIIPYYNVKKELLDRCIESILDQTFKNFEILIIDDGSDKMLADYLDNEILSLDKRIIVYHQENQGVSSARNNGIRLSNGTYVAFVDADDVVLPYFLEEAYSIAQKYNSDFVLGGVVHTKKIDLEINRENLNFKHYEAENISEFRYKLIGNPQRFGEQKGYISKGPVAKLIKKTIADRVHYREDLWLGEDNIWNLDILDECKKISVVNQIWYIYYMNSLSVTRSYNETVITQSELFLKYLCEHVNLKLGKEYVSYVDRIILILYENVYCCLLGHKERKISNRDRSNIIKYLYTNYPWVEILNYKYFKNANWKNKIKSILYRFHLLIFFWDIKKN